MSLRLAGINHTTAPLAQRETLAFAEPEVRAALETLRAEPGVREGMLLSTCNRVELLVEADADFDLPGFLGRAHGREIDGLRPLFYHHEEDAAVRHVFRVAASLDSLVIGEPQILGQMKQAFGLAAAAGSVGARLDTLLNRAFHTAKRVRTETEIAAQTVSVSHLAVDLARQIFGDLSHKEVLLVGAGAMGALAARYLLEQGAARLVVANRTLARAELVAGKFGATAVRLEELPERGEAADVVICCTGSPEPLISRAQAAAWLSRRRQRPMLFLDLAVPRDVEPSVHQLENAFVYNVDDLEQAAQANAAGRRQEAERAEGIIEAEVVIYLRRRRERDVVPTLQALQVWAESLRQGEWERVRRRLGTLSPDQEQAIEALTRGLVQKLLHRPLVELKGAAGDPAQAALVELTHRLFALAPTAAEDGAVSEEGKADARSVDSVRHRTSG